MKPPPRKPLVERWLQDARDVVAARQGRPSRDETRSIDLVAATQADAGQMLNVSEPSVQRARKVQEHAAPEVPE